MKKILWILNLLFIASPALAGDFFEEQGDFFSEISCQADHAHEMKGITTLGILYPNPLCSIDKLIIWNQQGITAGEKDRPFYSSVKYRQSFCKEFDLSKVTFEPDLFEQACSLPATYATFLNLLNQLNTNPEDVGIAILEDWKPTDFPAGIFGDLFLMGFPEDQPVVIARNVLLAEIATKKSLEASAKLSRKHSKTTTSIEIVAATQMMDFYRHSPLQAVTHAFSQLQCEQIHGPSKPCFVYRDMLKMALSNIINEQHLKSNAIKEKFEKIYHYVTTDLDGNEDELNIEIVYRFKLIQKAMQIITNLHESEIYSLSEDHPLVKNLNQSLLELFEIGIDERLEGTTSYMSDVAMIYRALSQISTIDYLHKKLNQFEYHDISLTEKEFALWKNSFQYESFSQSFQDSMTSSMEIVNNLFKDFAGQL